MPPLIVNAVVIDDISPVLLGSGSDARMIVSVRDAEGKVISGLDETSFKVQPHFSRWR